MKTKSRDFLENLKFEILHPYNLSINLLALFSTIAIGLLSYAGAIAIGFSFSLAITAFLLTAIVSLQVNLAMIKKAVINLEKFLTSQEDLLKNILFIIIAILSTISISATTLLSAVELFSFASALIITTISGIACFFISFQTLEQAMIFIEKFNDKITKFNNELEERAPITRAIIILICLLLVLSASYYIVATATTWWVETQLGLLLVIPLGAATAINILTSPFAFITHALFSIINPLSALFKFSRVNFEFNFLDTIKNNYGLVFNPFYLINTCLAYTTSFLLFLAHSACHALMASRHSLVTISGTIVDFFADANFTIAREQQDGENAKTTAKKHNHHHDDDSDDDDEHSHEPFDFIVMLTQILVTLPLQVLAIPTTVLINLFAEPHKPISQIINESFKENFYFVAEYIENKLEHSHNHSHCNDQHNHNHDSDPNFDSSSDSVTDNSLLRQNRAPITPMRDAKQTQCSQHTMTTQQQPLLNTRLPA